MSITVGARSSPLSRAQVKELFADRAIPYTTVWCKTTGDCDKRTSLREMEKSDFFTRELDQMLLEGKIDIAVHSAKDLPDPLPAGLEIVMITEGVDPRDSLVFAKPLPETPLVATSSLRREQAVRMLFPQARFCDLRGTIEERLSALELVDGVVIAEAALIRLGLTHLTRLYLPGEPAPLQGKLAVVAREGEKRWKSVFST